ncbi:MAG: prepilin peptidase [Proteobacteria bacterium]|nr:prepilin peptidase [Pseudomonadota bacterium]
MNPYIMDTIVFLYGLCIGSFLNVCIFRIPASKSIIFPGSTCPNCNTLLKFYDNIPVLSYLILRGRCRNCHIGISMRYPITELITGVSALFVYYRFGLSIDGLIYFIFISALIVITFIDIDHQIIPDVISLPGIPVCILFACILDTMTLKDSLIGVLAGGGSLYAVAWTYKMLTAKEGMGGGDIKLLAMIGALLGWQGVLFTIFAGSAIGTIAGMLTMIYAKTMNMKLAIPFGPFLSAGAVLYLFYGPTIIKWYFSTLM